MAPIPGEPHKSKPQELDLGDGRKFKLKLPGAPPTAKPEAADEPDAAQARDAPEPPSSPTP